MTPAADSTAIYAEFVPVPEIESGRLRLAFNHAPEFTISQPREVYEAVGWTRRSSAPT